MPTRGAIGLLEALELNRTAEANVFIGKPTRRGNDRTHGGDWLARCVLAALPNVRADLHMHALHAHFVSAGENHEDARFTVESIRDGGSSAVRDVRAHQGDQLRFMATLSFAACRQSRSFQPPPPLVAAPDSLPSVNELRLRHHDMAPGLFARWARREDVLDFRPVEPMDFIRPNSGSYQRQYWLRFLGTGDLAPGRDAVLLALMSDMALIDAVVMPFGLVTAEGGARATSLNHSLWRYEPFALGQWLLVDQTCEVVRHGRGTVGAQVFAESGSLVAAFIQEGMFHIFP